MLGGQHHQIDGRGREGARFVEPAARFGAGSVEARTSNKGFARATLFEIDAAQERPRPALGLVAARAAERMGRLRAPSPLSPFAGASPLAGEQSGRAFAPLSARPLALSLQAQVDRRLSVAAPAPRDAVKALETAQPSALRPVSPGHGAERDRHLPRASSLVGHHTPSHVQPACWTAGNMNPATPCRTEIRKALVS